MNIKEKGDDFEERVLVIIEKVFNDGELGLFKDFVKICKKY